MARRFRIVRNVDYLRVSIDTGAGSIKIAQQHVRAGIDPRNVKRVPVKIFQELRAEIKSTIAYDRAEVAYLGRKSVNDLLRSRPWDVDSILDLFKLAICYEYRSNIFVTRIREYLRLQKGDFGELQVLFTDIFRIILQEIRKFNRTTMRKLGTQDCEDSAKYWEDIHIELQLPMPSHWDNIQRGILFQAAKAAGFKEVIIRSETLCAAADLCVQHYEAGDLSDGDNVLILDLGCSTTGGATVGLRMDEDDELTLVEIGYSHEYGVGGQSVTDRAYKRLPMSSCSAGFANLQDLLTELSLTEAEFYRQFSDEFEACKRKFPAEEYVYPVVIRGSNGRLETFGLSKHFMEECFKFVAGKIAEVVSWHINENAEVMRPAAILCGGGAQNEFNRDYLGKHLASSAIGIHMFPDLTPHENHVAHGALGLYPEPESAVLPEQQSLYIALSESHKAYKLVHLFSSRAGSHDESNVVDVDFSFFADLDTPGPRLKLSIYGSEQDDLDGQDFYVRKGKRRDGLEEWPLHFADPPTWPELEKNHGIRPEDNGKGRQVYNLTTRVAISKEADSLMVTTTLYAGSGIKDRGPRKIWDNKSELWNAHRSHNVSNGRAPVRELPARKRIRLLGPQQPRGSMRSRRRRRA